jgi:hypothetical protein
MACGRNITANAIPGHANGRRDAGVKGNGQRDGERRPRRGGDEDVPMTPRSANLIATVEPGRR